jgi:hypothetical protein
VFFLQVIVLPVKIILAYPSSPYVSPPVILFVEDPYFDGFASMNCCCYAGSQQLLLLLLLLRSSCSCGELAAAAGLLLLRAAAGSSRKILPGKYPGILVCKSLFKYF